MNKRLLFVLIAGLISISGVLQADVLIQRTGALNANSGSDVTSVGWSQANPWTGVDITLDGYNYHNDGVAQTADVYLTTMIGPGTTMADEIAHTTLSSTTFGEQTFTVFTGLNLAPGTYYLSFDNPLAFGSFDGLFWAMANFGTPVQVGTGVTDGGTFSMFPPEASYPPASNLSSSGFTPIFSVTGTPGSSSVPEPGSLLLLGAGLMGLAGLRRNR